MDDLTDIGKTWNAILEDVRSGKIKTNPAFECRYCFNSGWREVPDPKGSDYRGVVRCDRCAYWPHKSTAYRTTKESDRYDSYQDELIN